MNDMLLDPTKMVPPYSYDDDGKKVQLTLAVK